MRLLAIAFLVVVLVPGSAMADLFRATPDLAIPDNDPAGVTTSLEASPSAVIGDVNIVLEVDHTWTGDLIFKVTHGGTTVTIADRPGRTASGVGCGADLACARPVILDDEAATIPIECSAPSDCATCFPGDIVAAGSYIPNEVLSAFDGADQTGTWTLFVSDNAADDVGVVCAWEVRTNNTVAVEPATWGRVKASYRE
jgi:subtilisin-like proprotein convertase family protein